MGERVSAIVEGASSLREILDPLEVERTEVRTFPAATANMPRQIASELRMDAIVILM
jgi:hypothetical protein